MKIFALLLCLVTAQLSAAESNWTILYYAAGSNSCEETLLDDLAEIKRSIKNSEAYKVVVLIDRVEGFSADASTFGEDFTDTRLYELTANSFRRLTGKEYFPEKHDANMGDAATLKKFIQYGKKYYPAKQYALFMYSHGDGISFCVDVESDRDALYPAELTDVLTENESVDIMALDVCSMAGIEIAYEWRPEPGKFGSKYLVASAPVSAPWDYTAIFERLTAKMTPLEMGSMLIEEIYKSQPWCSWGFFDLTKAKKVKTAFDRFISSSDPAKLKLELMRAQASTINYLPSFDSQNAAYYRMRIPFFDFYDLMSNIQKKETREVLAAIDEMVIKSYYATSGDFLEPSTRFDETRNGVYIFFSFGPEWVDQQFYSPLSIKSSDSYGNMAWCKDGATPGNAKPENWFELLDFMYDEPAQASSGGVNRYKY